MLIGLLTILLLGGSAGSGFLDFIGDVQDDVKAVVPKGDHQKAALDVLKEIQKGTKSRNKAVDQRVKDLGKLLEDYTASDDEIDTVWDQYFTTLETDNNAVVELRFKLKEHMTEQEWASVFNDD